MSMTVVSAFARRGRHGRAIHAAPLTSLKNTPQHRQQTRGYRLGRLSAYLQPYIHPDVYTRHPSQGYGYCDNLHRRRPWDRHALAEDAKSTLKRAVNSYWSSRGRAGHSAGRCLNTQASPTKTPDNPDGIRAGQNIEDVERAPLEHLLFGDKENPRAGRKHSPTAGQRKSGSPDGEVDGGLVIDPITNRKAPRTSTGSVLSSDPRVDVPIKTFRSYRAQFQPFRPPQSPIFSDGPPPEAELKLYGQDKPWDLADGTSAVNHHGAPPPSLLEALNWGHRDVLWHSNHNIASSSAGSMAQPWLHSPVTPQYTDLHQYTAVMYQEPDGKPNDEQTIQQHVELDQYGAVRAHEPDGMYKAESDFSTQPHELGEYGEVRSHEPDGKYAAEYTEAPDEAELAAYSKPFLAHEPDGKYAANHVESETDAEELAKYRQPFFSHEPDGMYAASHVEPQQDELELSRYTAFRSHEPDGKYAANHVEENPGADELATYGAFRSHEPDGKYAADHVGESIGPDDLTTYGAFRSHEPDGKYATDHAGETTGPDDLTTYGAFRSHEPDGKYAADHAGETTGPDDLTTYGAFRSHEPDGKYAADYVEENPEADDVATYGAFRSHEPDGKYAQADAAPAEPTAVHVVHPSRSNEPDGTCAGEGKAVIDPAKEDEDLANHEAFSYDDAETRLSQQESGPTLQHYEPDGPVESSASEAYDPEELRKYQAVRWNEPDGKPVEAKTADGKDGQDQGSKPLTHSGEVSPATPTEPALYKILVYDPTMQSIEIAETSSIVPDSAAPMTPAEVLLRISNPARFFPHFAPLQAQGFEIVSGSGDVLIFRKVRDPLLAEAAKEQPSSSSAGGGPSSASFSSINPIDMTGGQRDYYAVAAGRFASPTGFVNYDLPPADSAIASLSPVWGDFRGGASAREERDEGEEGGKKGRNLPQRVVVGAVWLAGLSYSLGVVSEYFKSGGMDGNGPKGL